MNCFGLLRRRRSSARVKNRFLTGCLVLLVSGLLAGCGVGERGSEKLSEPDYTLVAAEDVPQELQTQIDSSKMQEMKFTFFDEETLYIVRGYGAQPAGSSIQVLELYATKEGLFLDTQLVGGGENKENTTTSAYPYIVVKLQSGEQNVVFE